MGTFLTGTFLVIILGFIIKGMIKDKKAGRSVVCGGDCKHCGGHCSQ